jgi:uncharacterized membrane protein YkoI
VKRLSAMVASLAVAIGAGVPAASWAKAHHRGETKQAEQLPAAVTRAGMSLDDAVQMVQQRFNARVVKAEERDENGRTVYHLRLLSSDGKVWTVKVDAQSGAIR